jgi:hypothetical protein
MRNLEQKWADDHGVLGISVTIDQSRALMPIRALQLLRELDPAGAIDRQNLNGIALAHGDTNLDCSDDPHNRCLTHRHAGYRL